MVTGNNEKIGERLKSWVEENFASVKEFGQFIKIDPKNLYSHYFKGKSLLGGEKLLLLSQRGLDINWLLDDSKKLNYQNTNNSNPIINEQNNNYLKKHDLFDVTIPIIGSVPAGRGEYKPSLDPQSFELQLRPDDQFAIRIDAEYGWSMQPFINENDIIICSWSEKINDGDIVIARWDKSRGGFKIYNRDTNMPDIVILTSYNPAEKPIFVPRSKLKVFKVVLIKKK